MGALWGVCQPLGGEVKGISSLIHFSWLSFFQISVSVHTADGSISFIFKHLLGTPCVRRGAYMGGGVKVEAVFHFSNYLPKLTAETMLISEVKYTIYPQF